MIHRQRFIPYRKLTVTQSNTDWYRVVSQLTDLWMDDIVLDRFEDSYDVLTRDVGLAVYNLRSVIYDPSSNR